MITKPMTGKNLSVGPKNYTYCSWPWKGWGTPDLGSIEFTGFLGRTGISLVLIKNISISK